MKPDYEELHGYVNPMEDDKYWDREHRLMIARIVVLTLLIVAVLFGLVFFLAS